MNGEYNPLPSARIGIFWDFENYPLPSGFNGCDAANRLRLLGQQFGSVVAFKAYLDQSVTMCTKATRSQLQSSGVSLTDCPRPDRTRKDVADKMIMADIMAFAYDNPLPSIIMLISGDKDFAYAVSVLRNHLFSVILVHRGSDVSPNLVMQPDIVIDGSRVFERGWEDMLTQLPALPDRRAAFNRSRAIEDGSTQAPVQEDVPFVQQAEEAPTRATITEVIPDESGEGITPLTAPSNSVGLESELEEEVSVATSDSVEEHREVPMDSSHPPDPAHASTPLPTLAVTESNNIAPPLNEAPPSIPPRPLGYPSAKVSQFTPLVDYPESSAGSSQDENPESNLAETSEDITTLPPLDVRSLPSDLESVPPLTFPSSSTASSSSVGGIPEIFLDLVDILDQARCMGIEFLNPETLEQMVLHRNPDLLVDVRVKRFGTYLRLACNEGIVEYSRMSQGVRLKEIL
ncbi:hypothetical protein FRC04_005425 [Tulasnella sp. 424]|nr:hypothetical protein FRC04_005425 [Tulasnella sp. 424]KAG8962600.1 hypothetical protein FRC05_005279 [Tulasnella sp. 425]